MDHVEGPQSRSDMRSDGVDLKCSVRKLILGNARLICNGSVPLWRFARRPRGPTS
jgi:hypothetical protein